MSDRNPFTNAKLVAKNYDSEKYHQQDAKRGDRAFVMSRSHLHEFALNPWKWLHGALPEGEDDTKATRWGSLLDTRLLDNARFGVRYVVRPEQYDYVGYRCPRCASESSNRKQSKCKECGVTRQEFTEPREWSGNAAECKEWVKSQGAKTIVTNEEMADTGLAIKRMLDNGPCNGFLGVCDYQIYCTADYQDDGTGLTIPVKVLIDCVPKFGNESFGSDLGDLKTARTLIPRVWQSEVLKLGYAMQAAINLDVYNPAEDVGSTPETAVRQGFVHACVENTHPYYPELRRLSAEFIAIGRAQYQLALARYAQSLAQKFWPGYKSDKMIESLALVEPPAYAAEVFA